MQIYIYINIYSRNIKIINLHNLNLVALFSTNLFVPGEVQDPAARRDVRLDLGEVSLLARETAPGIRLPSGLPVFGMLKTCEWLGKYTYIYVYIYMIYIYIHIFNMYIIYIIIYTCIYIYIVMYIYIHA